MQLACFGACAAFASPVACVGGRNAGREWLVVTSVQAKSVLKNLNFCLHGNAAYFREENLYTDNKDMVKQSAAPGQYKSQGCVCL